MEKSLSFFSAFNLFTFYQYNAVSLVFHNPHRMNNKLELELSIVFSKKNTNLHVHKLIASCLSAQHSIGLHYHHFLLDCISKNISICYYSDSSLKIICHNRRNLFVCLELVLLWMTSIFNTTRNSFVHLQNRSIEVGSTENACYFQNNKKSSWKHSIVFLMITFMLEKLRQN